MNHKGTNRITKGKITLRRFEYKDAKEMFDNWASDDNVTKWLTWNSHLDINETKSTINEWISNYKRNDFYHWAILYNNDLVGSIGVNKIDGDIAIIGYCLSAEYQNKGIMTKCLSLVESYLFNDINFNEIKILCSINNAASIRVVEKNNYKLINEIKNYRENKNDIYENYFEFSKLKNK